MERTDRLNSLLKEVLSEVIRKDLHHLGIPEMTIITRVEITKDLRHAKVFISLIGDDKAKKQAVEALTHAASQIAHTASKKVVMRYFPHITFHLDSGVEHQLRVQELLNSIDEERSKRPDHHDS